MTVSFVENHALRKLNMIKFFGCEKYSCGINLLKTYTWFYKYLSCEKLCVWKIKGSTSK